MNSRSRSVYLLPALLVLSGCAAGERYNVTVNRQWPAAGIDRVEVRGVNGNLHVEASNTDDVRLIADIKARGMAPKNDPNRGYFETEIEGSTLRIGHKKKVVQIGFPFRRGSRISIDYTLRVPQRLAIDLNTVNGHIATKGVSGDAQLKSVNGGIDAEVNGQEEFQATTVNGRIRASFTEDFRGAQLKSVNGGVQAILPASASFTCDLAQVNGDFEASFPLSIHSNPGRRRVSGEVNGGRYELKITTVNGSVRVKHLEPPTPPPPPAMPEIPPVPAAPPPQPLS